MPALPPEQRAIISSLLASDEELANVAREFVKAGMAELLVQLKRGDASTRAQIARAMAGPVLAAITEPTESDPVAELRGEMHRMMDEMKQEWVPDQPPDPLLSPSTSPHPKAVDG